jgi:uncharacterized RDD family membrane protein YckC
MREDYRLLTPENVELRYDVAGLGSRLGAALIDYAIIFSGYLALLFGSAAITAFGERIFAPYPFRDTAYANALIGAALVIAFFGWWGYFLLFELLWGGQSPGKRALGLRVVRRDGQPLGFTPALVRNTLRWIDQPGLIGVFIMLVDSESRRLGDLAAGTLVVREPRALKQQALQAIPMPHIPEARVQALPNAARITMAEYSVIREYFGRAPTLLEADADRLANRLASGLARSLEIEAELVGDSRTFLATVARAYEARHRFADTAGTDSSPPRLTLGGDTGA